MDDVVQKMNQTQKLNHLFILLIKKWNQECKQTQYRFFDFCNIFDLLTSRIVKTEWWPLFFKPDFYIFSYYEQLRKR